ncbi:tetratricopeptide repeat protein [Nocardia sp. NPDC059246]|uniref:tetratricopeptide repeat protein n=1 Tax=Nocardia sp. NPDC059246 TaxID=3346789 RepID=UPI0036AE399F
MTETESSPQRPAVDARGANIGAIGDPEFQLNYFSVTLVALTARFWTEPLSPPPPPSLEHLHELGVSALLGAHFQIVPYVGRLEEQADLVRWRDALDTARSIRLLHGPGGMGKTRLAMQFAYESQENGWAVAVAHQHSEPATVTPTGAVTARGLLLLVDYAERWRRDDLESLVRDFACNQPGASPEHIVPVRVLLLARPSGLWWTSLANPLSKLGFAVDEVVLTEPDIADRQALFAAARDRFAELRNVPEPQRLRPIGLLTDPAYRLTLTVQMAALVVVDAAGRGITPPGSPADLSGYLLNREVDHWAAMLDNHRITTSTAQMARLVAVAALVGAVAYDDATDVLSRVGFATDAVDQLVDDHRMCYPPLLSGTALQSLLPDRLAEDFLARIIPDPGIPSSGDPWASRIPRRLLAVGDTNESLAAVPEYQRHAVIVLVEAAHHAPHITSTVLEPLLRAHPASVVGSGGAALLRLVDLPGIAVTTLTAVDTALPRTRHTDLDVAAAAISSALFQHRLAHSDDPAQRAQIQLEHASRLAHAGHRVAALAPTEEAVAVYRRLAVTRPAAFEPELARALNNLGIRLSEVGRREEALAPSEEAVAVYRRLVAANPAAFEPQFAMALNNLAVQLSMLGRREEALAASKESVAVHRRLVAANPAVFEPDLAMALNNLGNRLLELGRREEALALGEESVAIRRRLAVANPALFEPDLAMALNSQGVRLAELGRREEALAASEEAVAVHRRLVAANPAAFEPDLAMALNNLGIRLAELGRREEALALGEESVAIRRRLAVANPTAFEPDLASALHNLGVILLAQGRRREALAPTEEAVDIRRQLAAANPEAFEPDLAKSFRIYARARRTVAEHHPDALSAAQQAVEIHRRLHRAHPLVFATQLAASVRSLAEILEALGRGAEAEELRTQSGLQRLGHKDLAD